MSWAGRWGPLCSCVPKLWAGFFSFFPRCAHSPCWGSTNTLSLAHTKAGVVNGSLNSR